MFSQSPEVDFLPVTTYLRLLTPKMLGITFKIFITTRIPPHLQIEYIASKVSKLQELYR